jgi:hypothetical protein
MNDADVNRAVDDIQKSAQAQAEDVIRTIIAEKNPGKRFKLVVSAAISYTLNWEPGQGL